MPSYCYLQVSGRSSWPAASCKPHNRFLYQNVRIIKTCLYGTQSKVKIWFTDFPLVNGLKRRNALSPQLFNFAVEYAIKRVQETNLGLDMNRTHFICSIKEWNSCRTITVHSVAFLWIGTLCFLNFIFHFSASPLFSQMRKISFVSLHIIHLHLH